MTSTLEDHRSPVPSPPQGGALGGIDIAPPARRSRVPEVLVGLVLIVGFAAGGVWWVTDAAAKDAVLAVRHDVSRGETLELEDLMVVHVGTDDQVATLAATASGEIVGKVAATDLQAGTIVTPSQFSAAGLIESGRGVVGVSLKPGAVPTQRLAAGDRVRVILAPGADPAAAQEPRVLVDSAEVLEVVGVGPQRQEVFVSLGMSERQAEEVSVGMAQDRIRLVQVAREGDG